MNEMWGLVILAAVIVLGGFLLSYRSGKHRAIGKNKEDETQSDK